MKAFTPSIPESKQGLYRKYSVKRLRDKERKHAACEYYVLDLQHDRFAAPALRAYAAACVEEFPELAADLNRKALRLEGLFQEEPKK